MKRLAILLTALPGAVLAHGAHPPVPETAHGPAHALVLGGLAVVLIVLALARAWRDRT